MFLALSWCQVALMGARASSTPQEPDGLVDAIDRHEFSIINRLFWLIESWDEELSEAELCCFLDPILTALHQPNLAG
jgi:hypothetical protein